MTKRTLSVRGAEIALEDVGQEDPALVFLHYWGGSARSWSPVIKRLPALTRAVAISQRGWGGSRVTDGRYDLEALADDVAELVTALAIERYVLVGHSMGGKVAQLLAGRRVRGLAGLVLAAPAPPTPLRVPAELRAGMLASYQSRNGVIEALNVLAGPGLDDAQREQVIEDTLRGDAEAKQSWPSQGMAADISAALDGCDLPIEILVGNLDQVEREPALRPIFARHLPQAVFTTVPGAGHLLPFEAPQAIVAACERILTRLS